MTDRTEAVAGEVRDAWQLVRSAAQSHAEYVVQDENDAAAIRAALATLEAALLAPVASPPQEPDGWIADWCADALRRGDSIRVQVREQKRDDDVAVYLGAAPEERTLKPEVT